MRCILFISLLTVLFIHSFNLLCCVSFCTSSLSTNLKMCFGKTKMIKSLREKCNSTREHELGFNLDDKCVVLFIHSFNLLCCVSFCTSSLSTNLKMCFGKTKTIKSLREKCNSTREHELGFNLDDKCVVLFIHSFNLLCCVSFCTSSLSTNLKMCFGKTKMIKSLREKCNSTRKHELGFNLDDKCVVRYETQ